MQQIHILPLCGLGLYKVQNASIVKNLLLNALEIGYRHFDTAIIEGKYRREDIFLTSKFFPFKDRTNEEQLRSSLTALQTSYLDLWLLHWSAVGPDDKDNFQHKPVHVVWQEMEQCHSQGLTKNIGVSNFNAQSLIDLLTYSKVRPVTNQIELHVYLQQPRLLALCKRFGVSVTAYCPLGRGQNMLQDERILQIAQKYQKTAAQVVLNYLACQLQVSVIPKTERIERLRENFEWTDFTLSQEECEILHQLDKNERLVDPALRDWLGHLPLFD